MNYNDNIYAFNIFYFENYIYPKKRSAIFVRLSSLDPSILKAEMCIA